MDGYHISTMTPASMFDVDSQLGVAGCTALECEEFSAGSPRLKIKQNRLENGHASPVTGWKFSGTYESSSSDRSKNYAATNYSQDKLRSILEYLDEKDLDNAKTTEDYTASSRKVNRKSKGELPTTFHQQETMEFLDDQEALILSLRLQLNRETEKSSMAVQELEEIHKKRAKEQKDLYSTRLKSVQNLLDQANDEKKVLRERCDTIALDIKQMQLKYEKRLEEQEKRHQDDTKRARSQWEITEKERRQKWTQQRANQIKENTLKSVEPEIERILALHKDEMRQVQKVYESQLKHAEDMAKTAAEEKLRQTEDKFAERINDVRQQERHLADDIYARKMTEIEHAVRLEVAKKEEELLVNKEIYEERLRVQGEEFIRLRIELEKQRKDDVAREKEIAKQDRAAIEQQSKRELEQYRIDTAKQFEQWESENAEKYESLLEKKVQEITTKMKTARDLQIAQAVGALAEEMSRLQLDVERRTSTKTERLYEQHQQEVAHLQEMVETWKNSANDALEQVRCRDDLENNHRDMQADLESRLRSSQQKLATMEKERATLLEDTVQAYSDRLHNMDVQVDKLTKQLADAHQNHRSETDKLHKQLSLVKAENDSAFDAINERVRAMLSKKDAKIEMLRQQLLALHEQQSQASLSRNRAKSSAQVQPIRSVSATSRAAVLRRSSLSTPK